ncbi:hypothetical protein ACFPM7_23775 [Actinokineospora guangxiensis]|uniref:Lantibiotic biosynthesis dehydratase-like protein n=1 Tax=Actinokineospora guangxiensis TaxID=1490288 RepID=A0ABW0EVH3_9PSEU
MTVTGGGPIAHLSTVEFEPVAPAAVRVCGVPSTALLDLRGEATAAALLAVLRHDAQVASDGKRLAVAIGRVIGTTQDNELVPLLVGLRRALHSARRPGKAAWNDRTAAAMGPDLAERVRAWVSAAEHRRTAVDVVGEAVRRDEPAITAALRRRVAEPDFRHTVALASPSTAADLDRWLDTPGSSPPRRLLVTLAAYLGRAAAKTSPFGGFLTVGMVGAAAGTRDARVVFEIKALLLHRVRERVAEAAGAPLRVTPSLRCDGLKAEFLGRPPAETINRVDLTPAVRAVLAAAPADRARLIAAASPHTSDPGALVRAAEAAGLLEPDFPVPDLAPGQFSALASWLENRSGQRAAASSLRVVEHAMTTAAAPSSGGRPDLTGQRITSALAEAARALGLDVPRGNPVHQTFAAPSGVTADVPADLTAQLAAAVRWLLPFELTLPLRAVAAWLFRQEFGAGARVPVLRLHRLLQSALAGAGSPTGAEPLAALVGRYGREAPQARELAAAQRAALEDVVLSGTTASVPGRTAAATPSWVSRALGPVLAYVQQSGEAVVLNGLSPADGRGIHRVRMLAARAAGTVPPPAVARPGLLHVTGLFGSALNHHAPTSGLHLRYPGTTPDAPDTDIVDLGELFVRIGEDEDLRLVAAGHGDLVPSHAGMMSALLLPPAARMLVQLFGPLGHFPPIWTVLGEQGGRVTCGRVVLRRERVCVDAGDLRPTGGRPGDAAHLVRLARLRARLGVGERCFAKAAGWAGDSPEWSSAKAHKPLPVDFASPLSVAGLDRLAAKCGRVVLEEALPDPLDTPRVHELVVEVPG